MKRRTVRANPSLSEQVKEHVEQPVEPEFEVDFNKVVSTGSTLLDLAISGSRHKQGGIPGGILVEIFGPSGAGKTVLLCEIAGAVTRGGGEVMFKDPEARLDKQFASMFDMNIDNIDYSMPNTVPEVFTPVREWEPKSTDIINGIFADSLAALSTDMEMEGKDQYGMRRAKEFSEECRKTCRTLQSKNLLMVCSNQIRENLDAGPYGQKYVSPGGKAIGFYSSLRLRCSSPKKIKSKISIRGKQHTKVIGVETQIEVYKSSIAEPYNSAPIYILFDYGIDDIRGNLQFVKELTGNTVYAVGEQKLDRSMEKAIDMVEEQNLEKELKNQVILLWQERANKFKQDRKTKVRI